MGSPKNQSSRDAKRKIIQIRTLPEAGYTAFGLDGFDESAILRGALPMPTSRLRRLFWRAITALAVVVLLPTSYVGSYGAVNWIDGHGFGGGTAMWYLDKTVFAPIRSCSESGWRPAMWVLAFGYWCQCRGEGLPVDWSEIVVSDDGIVGKNGVIVVRTK